MYISHSFVKTYEINLIALMKINLVSLKINIGLLAAYFFYLAKVDFQKF